MRRAFVEHGSTTVADLHTVLLAYTRVYTPRLSERTSH